MAVVAISNVSENVDRIISLLSPKDKQIEIEENGKLLAARNFLGALSEYNNEDELVFISPYPVNADFIDYALRLTGYQGKFALKVPEPEHTGLISEEILRDQSLLENLAALKDFRLTAYSSSTELNGLIAELKSRGANVSLDNLVMNWPAAGIGGTKNGLRELLDQKHAKEEYMDILMAPGKIYHSADDAIENASELLRTKSIVLKVPDSHAGLGVELVDTHFYYKFLPKRVIKAILKKRMSHNIWNNGQDVIVEEKLDLDESIGGGQPNVEIRINDDGPEILYHCALRLIPGTSIFRGVEFGKGVFEEDKIAQLDKIGNAIGWIHHEQGYRGIADIDMLQAKEVSMPNIAESNARKTGGSDAYWWAYHTFGPDFEKLKYFATNSATVKNVRNYTFSQVRDKFEDLLFTKEKGEGVVLTGPDAFYQNKLAYIIVANDRDRAHKIEENLLARADMLEPIGQDLTAYVRWNIKKLLPKYHNN